MGSVMVIRLEVTTQLSENRADGYGAFQSGGHLFFTWMAALAKFFYLFEIKVNIWILDFFRASCQGEVRGVGWTGWI